MRLGATDKAEKLGRLQVEDQLVFGWCLNRKIGGFGSPEYAMAVINCVPINVNDCGRPGQTCNKPGPDRIDHIRKIDWHALGALLQCGDA
jgi:hypothetical protein